MDRIALHSEVPAYMTCVKGANVTAADMWALCKDTLNCFTCAARNTNTFFKDETFDAKNSSIVNFWKDLKGIHGYENLTRADKIAKMAVFMKDKREER
eukprot:6922861-Heterocapsa_arctica.AAC.1